MNGLVGLVPTAEILIDFVETAEAAVSMITRLAVGDPGPLNQRSDTAQTVRSELGAVGVLESCGTVNLARAAELLVVCEILAAATPPVAPPPPEPRLVLSAPGQDIDIEERERLDRLVLDVIRKSRVTLHLGGGFWNQAGFDRLDEVIRPALASRAVTLAMYVNQPEKRRDQRVLAERIATYQALGAVSVRWYAGIHPRMLHAKFVIADHQRGYLGTANLTSFGLDGHIEAGIELTASQCSRFIRFLDQLSEVGQFTPTP